MIERKFLVNSKWITFTEFENKGFEKKCDLAYGK
jgi:hypothetical protein